jgi:hypothetical protein
MGGVKIDWRSYTCLQGFVPASHAKTPAVAFFQPWKIALRRYQVVTAGIGKFEKFIRHLGADRVEPEIARTGAAVTISIETGNRITAAAAQLSTKNICWHGRA